MKGLEGRWSPVDERVMNPGLPHRGSVPVTRSFFSQHLLDEVWDRYTFMGHA